VPDSPRMREGWSSFVFVLLLLLTMAWAYDAGGLAEGLRILPAVVALGACLGLACARLRVPGSLVHPLGLALGIVCCFLLLATVIVLPNDVYFKATAQDPGWWRLLLAKGQYMQLHLQQWLAVAMRGEASADPFPFVVQMAALQWIIAFYAAWFLFRLHWVWGAVVPAGLATFFGVYYAPPRLMIYFVAFMLLALILLVLVNIYQHQEDWRRHHVTYDRQIGLEFLRDGAVLAVVVMSLVWLLPRLPNPGRASSLLDQWQDPWRRVQQEWNRLYAALSYRESSGLTSFGRTVTLGGAISLSRTPIMEVQADDGRYWRAVVLDRYTGSGWADTNPTSLRLAPSVPFMDRTSFQSREVLTQTMQVARSSEAVLFAAGEPLRAQVATRVQVAPRMAGAGLDVSTIYLAQTLGRDSRYVVTSLVSTADIRSLRQAGASYQTDILERYLQMPETLPARIGELAHEIAGTQPTPYDQAVALESYLRQIKYNLSIPTPPGGRDPIDWFLFDNREGYCTYYASAMVLMCRTLGIPARFAQGYARGEWVPEHNAFLVRESDAHAWPEVYFPGYGWI
jgi:transglutaminase-like putative cysteine protease